MNVLIEAKELHRIVSTATRGASRHCAVEVLRGVLLEAEGGFLSAVCTDMEVTMAVSARVVKGKPRGRVVAADAKALAKAVKELAGVLELAVEGDGDERRLMIRDTDGVEVAWKLLPVEDYPRAPVDFDDHAVKLELPRAAIRAAEPALVVASKDESRPVLTGVRISVAAVKGSRAAKDGTRPSTMRIDATDSYRLHRTELPLRAAAEFAALVPGRALDQVKRLVGPERAEELSVRVAVSETHPLLARFSVLLPGGPARVWTRLIDGQFPNVDQLIPEACELAVTLDAGALEEASRKMAKLDSAKREKYAATEVKIGGGKVRIQGPSGSSVTVEADINGAEFPEIGFNGGFLADAMSCMFEGEVEWRLISPLRPVLFVQEPNEEHDSREVHLLMPIRLKG